MVKENRRFKTRFQPGWIDLSWRRFKAKTGQFIGQIAGVLFVLSLVGCGTIKKVEVEHRVETHFVDSTIWHVDTNYFDVPREVYRDYTGLLDTLNLETGVAKAWAAIDTNKMMLSGEIENKPVKLEKEYVWKEKLIYRDSLVYQEVPIEIEVVKETTPKWAKWTLGICIALLGLGVWNLKKRLF